MKRLLILFLLISTVSAADFNVSWTPIKEDIVNKEYIITIQNLDTDMRTVDVESFFEDTNFDTSQVHDVQLIECGSKKFESKVLKKSKIQKEVSHGKITFPSVKSVGKKNNKGTKTFILKFKTPPDGSYGKVGLKINGKEYHPYWNSTWSNRKKITLTGNTSGSQTDYQLLLNVTYEPEMNSDFSDVRFCNNTDQLSAWLESKVNESYALIWIKFPHTPDNGETEDYWMYYGNSEASACWNVNNTFIREIGGVVSSWHFDEGSGTIAYDTSGNGNDGTINGATWTDGEFGETLNFDGSDDYVDCGNDDSLNFNTGDFSISAWVKHIDQGGMDVGICFGDSEGNDNLFLRWDDRGTTNIIRSKINGKKSANIDYNTYYDNWTFITIIRKSGTGYIYINGIEKDNWDANGDISNNVRKRIGVQMDSEGSSPSNFFCGLIDEIQFYNKFLNTSEISDLFNNYGYTTLHYPGKVLVRKHIPPEPTYAFGDTGYYVDSIYFNSSNPYYNLIDYKGDIALNHTYSSSDNLEWTAQAIDDDTGLVVTSMGSSEIDFTTYEGILDWLQLVNLDDSKIYTLQNSSGDIEEHQASGNAVNFTTDLSPDNYEIEITAVPTPSPTVTPTDVQPANYSGTKLSDSIIKSFYYPFMYILFIVIIIGGFMHVFGN